MPALSSFMPSSSSSRSSQAVALAVPPSLFSLAASTRWSQTCWIVWSKRSRRTEVGQLRPVCVVEVRADQRAIEVLEGAADGGGAHELDRFELRQDLDVVADVPERLAQFLGELRRAGDALVEGLEDALAERVAERLHQARIDARPVVLGPVFRFVLEVFVLLISR